MEYIGAYLATPFNGLMGTAYFFLELSLFFLLQFKELSPQVFHTHFPVLHLGTFILALHDDARRLVSHAHG